MTLEMRCMRVDRFVGSTNRSSHTAAIKSEIFDWS
jgi:hypothetical protein